MKILRFFLVSVLLINTTKASACSPCQALQNITTEVVGNELILNFSSNAGWLCCYNVQIEIVCADAAFTGIFNYLSPQICFATPIQASTTTATILPYPPTIIDISSFCPGQYKWRGSETGCGILTPEFTFTVVGAPLQVSASASETEICLNESSNLAATAQNGCANGGFTYSWSPTTGLSNPASANPVATPTATTTYSVTITENGTCGNSMTSNDITVQVNPLPTATIAENVGVCLNDPSPTVTITGQGGTPPYEINYMIDGVAQSEIVTTGSTYTFSAPTNTVGTVAYTLIDVTDSSPTECYQLDNSSVSVTVYPLPVVNAGPDIQVCEPNPTSPSLVTLNGSGASTYVWDNGITNGVAFVPPTGVTTYTVTGTTNQGCEDTDEVVVTAYPLPVANFTASPLIGNAPLEVNYLNQSSLANNFVWNFGDGAPDFTSNSLDISHTFSIPGTFTTVLTASNGICFTTFPLEILVFPPMIVVPPNVFTPNGDNANEMYFVDVEYGVNIEAEIFNRWGLLIATINGLNAGWDGKSNGKPVDDGVYFVKYLATDYSGNQIDGHTYFHLIK